MTAESLVAVLLRNRASFLGFLERRLGSLDDAEDVLQDAFVRSLERADSIRDSEAAIPWFYRLLRNAISDHFRRQGAQDRVVAAAGTEVLGDPPPPADSELMKVVCGCLIELAATLPESLADVISEVDLGDGEIGVYARARGITANNATVRLHRARKALRKRVVECCSACEKHRCQDCSCRRL